MVIGFTLSDLVLDPWRVYTRLQFIDSAFGEAHEGYERTMDARIKNIRQKMGNLAQVSLASFISVCGASYKLEKS